MFKISTSSKEIPRANKDKSSARPTKSSCPKLTKKKKKIKY
jgi:hypothetical protein